MRNIGQYYTIEFCVKLEENFAETYEKLKNVFGDFLSRVQVFSTRYFRKVEKDKPRRCSVSTKSKINVKRVKASIYRDRRLIVRMIVKKLNLIRDAVHKISDN